MAVTGLDKKLVKRVVQRIKRHGTNLIYKKGPKYKVYKEMLDYIEDLFIKEPYLTFKKAY